MGEFEQLKQELSEIKKLIKEKQEAEQLLTTDQVAELLQVDRRTVYNYRDQRILTAYGVGKLTRYKKSEVMAALVQINGRAA